MTSRNAIAASAVALAGAALLPAWQEKVPVQQYEAKLPPPFSTPAFIATCRQLHRRIPVRTSGWKWGFDDMASMELIISTVRPEPLSCLERI